MTDYDPKVNQRDCIGCGLCPDILGEVFHIRDHRGLAYVHDPDGWRSLPNGAELLESAERNCPTGAISAGKSPAAAEDVEGPSEEA